MFSTTLPISQYHTSHSNSRSDSPQLSSYANNCHQLTLPTSNKSSSSVSSKAAAAVANCENKSPHHQLTAPSAVSPLTISTINDVTSSLNLANHKSPCLSSTANRMLNNCSNKEMRLDVSMGFHNSSSGAVIPISPVAAFGNSTNGNNSTNNSSTATSSSEVTSGLNSGFSLPVSHLSLPYTEVTSSLR